MADEILIGFDAREAGECDPRWDDARRGRYLLRADVARPLSVDRLAWPSLADVGHGRSLSGEERERLGIGWNGRLWASLDRMTGYLDEQGADPAESVLVAVGWVSRVGFTDTAKGPHPIRPSQRSRRKAGTCSATTSRTDGCSADSPTADTRPKRASGCAGSGLPSSTTSTCSAIGRPAFAFAEVTNARVPEHAPFHVFSLYRLP